MSGPIDADTGSTPGAGSQKPSPEPGDIVPASTAGAGVDAQMEARAGAGSAGHKVSRSTACIYCSYNLVGLDSGGNCPECGCLISLSVRSDLLRFSSPAYVRELHAGLVWILASVPLSLLLLAVRLFEETTGQPKPASPSSRVPAAIWDAAWLLVQLASAIGYWRYATPDPDRAWRPWPRWDTRRSLRATACLIAILSCANASYQFLRRVMEQSAWLDGLASVLPSFTLIGLFAAWCTMVLVVLEYSRLIAARVPDPSLARRANRYLWLLPVLAGLGWIILLAGPLVALVMYWTLLYRIEKHTRLIIATKTTAGPRTGMT